MIPNFINGALNLSTPNLPNFYNFATPAPPIHKLSHSTYLVNNNLEQNNPINNPKHTNKQQIALAIKSGQSPYKIFGLPDNAEEDEWC